MRRRGRGLSTSGTNPFDSLAVDYDDTFTHTVIGRVMRAAVWRRLAAVFPADSHVLELNCGTGADAAWLAERGVRVRATDASQGMVDVARARGIEATRWNAEDIGTLADQPGVGPFDGALSNFGGLNCVGDLAAVASGLGRCVRPGGTAVLCVMGQIVPWEWMWYLGQGNPRAAFRRLRRRTVWRGLTIRYPSVGSLRTTFEPWWVSRRVWALGALVPPSYVEPWAARHPRALHRLDRMERRVETCPLVTRLADHYVIELERR